MEERFLNEHYSKKNGASEAVDEFFNIYYPVVSENVSCTNIEATNSKCYIFHLEKIEDDENPYLVLCQDENIYDYYLTSEEAMIYQILLEEYIITASRYMDENDVDDYEDIVIDSFLNYLYENDTDIREYIISLMGIEE